MGDIDPSELAVVAARLNDLRNQQREDTGLLRTSIDDLRKLIESQTQHYVSRGEWGQRNEHVDSRLANLTTDVSEAKADAKAVEAALDAEIKHRRQPWTAVAASVIAIAGFALTVILNVN